MALDDYKGKVFDTGVDLVTIIKNNVDPMKPTKTSQLTNDSGYITTSGHVASANTANSAQYLTGTSGVSAGTYGPGSNVTIGNNGGSGTIAIPYYTVNAQGLITSIGTRTLKVTTGCNNCSNCSYHQCNYCDNCNCGCCDCGE